MFSPLETGGEKNKSFSVLLLGLKDTAKPLVLKVFFKNTPDGERCDNSLTLERTIYKQLLRPLLRNRRTPNLLRYYGSFSESYDDARPALGDCAAALDKLKERVDNIKASLPNKVKDESQMQGLIKKIPKKVYQTKKPT